MTAPCPRSDTLDIDLANESETADLARVLAAHIEPGDVITLHGELGAGKTAFARAFINALPAVAGTPAEPEEVPSPTFTLVQVYDRAPAPVWHFDLYRLDRPEDVYELGFEEALGQAVVLIEWPDRLGPLLPRERLEVHLTYTETADRRRARLVARGSWTERLQELAVDV